MMATRKRLATWVAVLLALTLVAGAAFLVRQVFFGPKTITAYFPTATAIYPGDEVRVSGIEVGTIESIEPEGTQTKLVLEVDRDVPVPAGANAVIVAQNLIAARYVQLTPAYRQGDGPKMGDGAVIPSDRTAVPVEWDEVKTQLMRLATELGPKPGSEGAVTDTSIGRFIDSAANAMDGNGDKLRSTLAELSGVARIFAEGSGNIVDIIKNLQIFVSALRDSKQQIVMFQNRLASLTSVVDNSRSDLDAALSDLSVAIGEVQRFVAGSREQTSEQIRSLAAVTQNLVDSRMPLENVLHVAPNAIANYLNIYYPPSGGVTGAFSFVNLANPVWFVCGMIGGIANTTAPETAKLCEQYLGPALKLLNFNNLPLPINPYLRPTPKPEASSTPIRSSRREVRGRAIRPSRRQRSRPTPASEMCHRRPVTAASACLPCRRACTGTTKCLPRRRPRSSRARRSRDRPTSNRVPAPSVQDMLLPPTPAPAAPPPGPLLPAEGMPPS